ncbi:MAG: Ig-like domain-containing protein [Tannerellaceae bacterium]|jgi:hypothetical protein|nr:Ig-like domain-containing protein [Tannerellaceae bacterium]
MKKIVLFTLLFSLFLGCEKGGDIDGPKEENPSTSVDDQRKQREEDIYKETGCRTKDADKIKRCGLFETGGHKYLYGSKEINNKESLWVSKYNQQGDCIWEKIFSDPNYGSFAALPFVLSNGNIVFSYVRNHANSIEVIAGTPIIVDINSGEITQVKTKEIYFFNQVFVFSDFFFCTLSDDQKMILSVEGNFSMQVSNNGDVINEKNIINIPADYTVWKDYENFVSISKGKINRGNIFKTEDPSLWDFYPNIPSGELISTSAYFDEDTVVVQFKYKISNEEKEYEYKLSYIDGKQLGILVESIEFEETPIRILIGKEIEIITTIYPENATDKNVTFEISNKDIADIRQTDGKYYIVAKSYGKTQITAKSVDGNKSTTCDVEVVEIDAFATITLDIGTGGNTMTGFYSYIYAEFNTNIGERVSVKELKIKNETGSLTFILEGDNTQMYSHFRTNNITTMIHYGNVLNTYMAYGWKVEMIYTWNGKDYYISYTR